MTIYIIFCLIGKMTGTCNLIGVAMSREHLPILCLEMSFFFFFPDRLKERYHTILPFFFNSSCSWRYFSYYYITIHNYVNSSFSMANPTIDLREHNVQLFRHDYHPAYSKKYLCLKSFILWKYFIECHHFQPPTMTIIIVIEYLSHLIGSAFWVPIFHSTHFQKLALLVLLFHSNLSKFMFLRSYPPPACSQFLELVALAALQYLIQGYHSK